ncbi:sensory protein (PAS domain) [Legionella steigerwaltii]|uniref:Sensory protein (PAS domain) n=1 Tax=Legionella steigerwaltii TaxID=460 RepID=A0A378LE57_9GAMM|nr:MASE3 domain-containing protein [Legionella steigerwaltii]KTD78490.1 sensory protein (PAS domain) [Legionella steigerwaltii]STY24152.1 sensory protein (PAS domain) [Legionella steigerwaltii]
MNKGDNREDIYEYRRVTYTPYVSMQPPLWRVFIPPIFLSLICILIEYKTNFLVFHTLTELISVFIGLTVMTVVVTTTQFTQNQFVVFISFAVGWCSIIDIAHILSYEGMNLLPHGGGNLSTQLWVSARTLQALSFLFSIYFFRHSMKIWVVNLVFFLIICAIFVAIFSGYFPTTYIDNYGVTWFKLYCEWGVVLILTMALILLWYEKAMISKELLFYISLSMISMILSDLAFSDYKNLFGFENIVGHIFKIFSFWFIYIALVVQTLRRPFAMLARAATTYDNIPDPTFIVQSEGTISQANTAAGKITRIKPEELVGLSSHMLFHNKFVAIEQCPICSQLSIARNKFIVEIKTEKENWVECNLSPIDSDLFPSSWVQIVRNITFRKALEEERKKLTYDLGERVKELQCLYTISNLIVLQGLNIEELFIKTVNELPFAFQFPENVVVKIESNWGEFSSDPKAKQLHHQLKKEFKSNGGTVVKINVFHRVSSSKSAVFLPEEVAFLDSVATLLQNALTRFYSEQKATEAEKRFQESEKHFQAFIEQAHFGVYIRNKKQFLYVNPRFCELVGRKEQDLLSIGLLDLIESESIKKLVLEQWEHLDRGESSITYNLPLTRKSDGVSFILRVDTTVISWKGNSEFLTIADDVTEIQHAKEQIDQYVAQLEAAIKGTFLAVSSMVELRDPYTAGHERRVGLIAKAIGEEIGWSAERCASLELMGLVHDIGKISIPAEILSKPTRLTEAEMALVRGHPQAGYDILKEVPLKEPVAEVILQHHERLDGSGYPRGLQGKEILPETLVIIVADVLEAMSSHRPYRPALGLDAAVAEIKRGRGILYDEEVVDAALKLIEKNKLPLEY